MALMRDELEHARQHRLSSAVYGLSGVALDAMIIAVRASGPRTLEGGAYLYNAVAHEIDANRAAAVCAAEIFGLGAVVEREHRLNGSCFATACRRSWRRWPPDWRQSARCSPTRPSSEAATLADGASARPD